MGISSTLGNLKKINFKGKVNLHSETNTEAWPNTLEGCRAMYFKARETLLFQMGTSMLVTSIMGCLMEQDYSHLTKDCFLSKVILKKGCLMGKEL